MNYFLWPSPARGAPNISSWFIENFCKGDVKDYQMTAWLMAICLNGMTDGETAVLTESLVQSGASLNWAGRASSHKVDKHSTGGVGDKVSLILGEFRNATILVE